MTAAEHITAAEKALKRAEAPHTTPSAASHFLRIAEVHTRLAAVVQTEAARDRDPGLTPWWCSTVRCADGRARRGTSDDASTQ